ncbi:putative phage abortive infection protein [Variovorax sp. S2]|uniref:putative phage abortive infection protein n=1 Tax=Variovorax sp. S12S4 TaxID=3029170 RepID=UPI00215D5263|nr:putative phage abortive infection protein [Variovorax sp. S12S4]MCR8956963.1 putative phage abortive infection protein [Variovorax sp. S12S4]
MLGKTEREGRTSYRVLLLLLALTLVAWGLGGGLVYWLNPDWPSRGPAGDMFGAVNALFTGCAFAALIFTIRQQSQELSLQREELKLTRGELAGQRAQMESQVTTLKLQQFENTFFQLVRTQADITAAIIVHRGHGNVAGGRFALQHVYEQLRDREIPNAGTNDLPAIQRAYENLFAQFEGQLGHYFRHLYHVLKFIDSSGVEDKRRYTTFVRAQLSSVELQLLFYNCLTSFGRENFKPLVEKYGMLKPLPSVDPSLAHRRHYLPSAFLPEKFNAVDIVAIGAVDGTHWTGE